MPLQPGTALGSYEISAKIGEGGMGEVYRAHDGRLDRDVALKVLPVEAVRDEKSRARLLQEARAAAALNHPNICTVHEVGEAEGHAFIAMEFIDGQSLDRLISDGGFAPDQVSQYTLQIAAAVAHAHECDIVHRDLKAANVVITRDGRAKVLDFGLAKRMSSEELAEASTRTNISITAPGTVVGTLPYMAPEQLRGEPATARSDVWALGVMLYELAAGVRPFRGQTGFELSAAIFSHPPPPLPMKVPRELRAVIERCLAKEPGARYGQANEVHAALEAVRAGGVGASISAWSNAFSRRRVLGGAAVMLIVGLSVAVGLDVGGLRSGGPGVPDGTQIRSLAVLPLENLTGDPDQAYFADGINDALITDLATLSDSLQVTARPSVLGYRGGNQRLSDIAGTLGVDAVITGSVMRAGDRVQITAQLIDATSEKHLWAERYERGMQNVLSMQNEIVAAIAGAIELRLGAAAADRLVTTRVVDPEAYEAYLRGRSYLERFTPADLDTALQYFDLALEEDRDYALALVGISDVWGRRAVAGVVPALEGGPFWKGAAEQAVALDETLAEAHGQLATALTWVDWDWEGAESAYQRAIDLNPNYASARIFYSHFLTALGRADEAEPHILRALELDPLVAFNYAMRAVQLLHAGRPDDAGAAFDEAFRIDPNLGFVRNLSWEFRAAQGRYEEALAAARQDYAERGDTEAVNALNTGAAESGYVGAMGRLAGVLADRPESRTTNPLLLAELFATAGQGDRTFEWLERAIEAHDINMVYVGVLPGFRHEMIRDDPRFAAVLRRMNLPQ